MTRDLALLALLAAPAAVPAQGSTLSLRFYGHGAGDVDRVKIPIDTPGGTVVKDTLALPGVTGPLQAKLAPPPAGCPLP